MKNSQVYLATLLCMFVALFSGFVFPDDAALGDHKLSIFTKEYTCVTSGVPIVKVRFSAKGRYVFLFKAIDEYLVFDTQTKQRVTTGNLKRLAADFKKYGEGEEIEGSAMADYHITLNEKSDQLTVTATGGGVVLEELVSNPAELKDAVAFDQLNGSFVWANQGQLKIRRKGKKPLTITAPAADLVLNEKDSFSPSGRYLVLNEGYILDLDNGKVVRYDYPKAYQMDGLIIDEKQKFFTIINLKKGFHQYELKNGKLIYNSVIKAELSKDYDYALVSSPNRMQYVIYPIIPPNFPDFATVFLSSGTYLGALCGGAWDREYLNYMEDLEARGLYKPKKSTYVAPPPETPEVIASKQRLASREYDAAIKDFNLLVRSANATVAKYNNAGTAQFLYKDRIIEADRKLDSAKALLRNLLSNHGKYLSQEQYEQVRRELANLPSTIYSSYN